MFLYVRSDDPTFKAGVEWSAFSWSTMSFAFRGVVAATALIALLGIATKRPASVFRLAALVTLFALTLAHGRFVKWFALAAIGLAGYELPRSQGAARTKLLARTARPIGVAALALGLELFFVDRDVPSDVGLGLDADWYPVSACNFARTLPVRGHMLNSFSFGSYLLFCLPEQPVAIDQRAAELYPPEFTRTYNSLVYDAKKVTSFADRYEVGWAFVDVGDPLSTTITAIPERWHLYYYDYCC